MRVFGFGVPRSTRIASHRSLNLLSLSQVVSQGAMHPQKSTVSPRRKSFVPPTGRFETSREFINGTGSRVPDGGHAALRRKKRETLLSIVGGVNPQFDTEAPVREPGEYNEHIGVAIGSRESTFGEGMASLRRHSIAEC